jgi:hypothetical protein
MRKQITQGRTSSFLRRVLELWPYLFIATSVLGLAYIALNRVW